MGILEERLIKLNEEEIFGTQEEIEIENSNIMKNLATMMEILQDIISYLSSRDTMLCEDANNINKLEMYCIRRLGDLQTKVKKYD